MLHLSLQKEVSVFSQNSDIYQTMRHSHAIIRRIYRFNDSLLDGSSFLFTNVIERLQMAIWYLALIFTESTRNSYIGYLHMQEITAFLIHNYDVLSLFWTSKRWAANRRMIFLYSIDFKEIKIFLVCCKKNSEWNYPNVKFIFIIYMFEIITGSLSHRNSRSWYKYLFINLFFYIFCERQKAIFFTMQLKHYYEKYLYLLILEIPHNRDTVC